MRKIILFWIAAFFIGCQSSERQDNDTLIRQEIVAGKFARATQLIDSLVMDEKTTDEQKQAYLFTKDSLHRVKIDFNKNKSDVIAWIKERHLFEPTDAQLSQWEQSKALEYQLIDGEKRYFKNAAANIFRVDSNARKLSKAEITTSESGADKVLHTHLQTMQPANTVGHFLLPKVNMHVTYTLSVKPNIVPDGTTIKAWLPYPRKDVSRQTDVTFTGASQKDYILSEDKTPHTSIYMEKKAVKDSSTVFQVEYAFVSQGEYFDLMKSAKINEYNKNSELYKKYTRQQPPQIRFTDTIKKLTDSITQSIQNPVEIMQACYRHIAANYPWASALEYSIIPNIPEYVIRHRKGDCGQVSLLLITMLRYKGIPARWQSGWMMHPDEVNLHDWAEVYFEGVGWVPVDMSFGRGQPLKNDIGRKFFLSGIDSYRLYINTDISGDFIPKKKFPRSEPYDFQRGEVETDKGNVYFDAWKYEMEVVYK